MIPGALAMLFSEIVLTGEILGIATGRNTSTLTLPAGVQANDFIIVVSLDPGGTTSLAVATGFTSGFSKAGTGMTTLWSYLQASGSISTISGLSARVNTIHLAIVFRTTTNPTTKLGSTSNSSSSIPNPASVSATAPYTGIAIVAAKLNVSNPTAPTTPTGTVLAGSYADGTATIAVAYLKGVAVSAFDAGTFGGIGSCDHVTHSIAITNLT